ncbi:nucleotide excision repair protein XP-D [Cyanidioschyzon merolae strain 10D]|jgi:DNA excision repair protein ERCC-2|uniref:DNA 5'-3' helicase n=1 Tax=Cyanidioschyzon merolae (strain NIES-3377 / 10D) TaxID=280699 RepID=M1VGY4_CYAM1|nr:nucleotide excision repair protein XP-D [Cyanidioschyzon merolae strain 10D]BAM80033.1 nucleotide excision repair protein XP-D [Cyanidioschyzon merolae strain 10D]|eukprot:XP_005536319.1 nucleotide excision repair protein XP-D [Cyanidioschyzon merolae strain 10D]
MIVDIEDLAVNFPYREPYPEQLQYMRSLKRALDAGGHAVIEMPSGTGKTVSILSLASSYISRWPLVYRKLVYCTRTVEEMEKVLAEAKRLFATMQANRGDPSELLCVGLAARSHLCVLEEALHNPRGVESACRALTASWVRERAYQSTDHGHQVDIPPGLCPFYERFSSAASQNFILPAGAAYSISDLREFGARVGWCPYFLARQMVPFAHIVVYSYQYILDPRVSRVVSSDFGPDTIIVFDEAHNIDNVCTEAFSVQLNDQLLQCAARNLNTLSSRVHEMKRRGVERLHQEYERLAWGISTADRESQLRDMQIAGLDPSALPSLVVESAPDASAMIPDQMRISLCPEIQSTVGFLQFLRQILSYVQELVDSNLIMEETAQRMALAVCHRLSTERRALQLASDRLVSLLWALEISDVAAFSPLQKLSDFCTLLGTYSAGFVVINDPEERIFHLACLDASLAMRPVLTRFKSVVITSGTLSPLWFYPRLLTFRAAIAESFPMSLERACLCPLIVTRGVDQSPISSQYSTRKEISIARNYGELLLNMADIVPDGVVCFFPSYEFMHDIVSQWVESDILQRLQKLKLTFVETQDAVEAGLAIKHYRMACDAGRGAVLLSVARGRAAEGIDFDNHYGRCALLFGVPFQYSESRLLKARLSYLQQRYQIREDEFLVFDAMRQAAQCVGRVIRNKQDYGIMIFADRRYARPALLQKLPRWIAQFLDDAYIGLDIGTAVNHAGHFLLQMAQPL